MSSTLSIGARRAVRGRVAGLSSVRRHAAASSVAGLAEVGLDHPLVGADLGRRALGDLGAVLQHGDPLGDAHHHLHVVLDQQDGDAPLVADPVHERGERRADSCGFMPAVGSSSSSSFGSQRQRAGDLEPALIAVGQVLGELVVGAADADELAAVPWRRSRASRSSWRCFGRAQDACASTPLLQVRVHAPPCTFSTPSSRRTGGCSGTFGPCRSAAIACGGTPSIVACRRSTTSPDVGVYRPGQHVEERGLAGAVRTDQRDDRALGDVEVDIVDGDETAELDAHSRARRASVLGRRLASALTASASQSARLVGRCARRSLGVLLACRAARDEALRAEQHHQHEHQAEDSELVLLQVDVGAEPVVDLTCRSRPGRCS